MNNYKGVCAVDALKMGGWITAHFLGTQIVDVWYLFRFTQKTEFRKVKKLGENNCK
ncbi:MAG: hypothetical protein R6V67_11950 [Spirochaetia bacterium]